MATAHITILEQNDHPAPETKTCRSLMMCLALLLCVVVSTTEAVAAVPVEQDSASLLAVVVRPSSKTNSPTLLSTTSTQTLLESLGRYTCPASGGFLDGACREPMFVPCNGTQRLAATTDRFVSLRASINAVADGDVWEWFWHGPDGKSYGPSMTTFRENFNGQKDCFIFSSGLTTLIVCGARSLDAEWGHSAIHDDGAAGLWNIEVRFNGQRALLEPFELLLLPWASLKRFTADNTLATEGALGVELNLQTAPGDPGLGTKVQLGLSPSSLSAGQISVLSPGLNSLRIGLPDHGIGRFETDAILTVQTETATARPDLQFSPTLRCGVPPIKIRSTLAIPLPVVFIHGLVPPDNLTKGQLSTWFSASFIEPWQMTPLFNFLSGATDSAGPTRSFNTSEFRLPYSKDESRYQTLYFGDWRSIAYSSSDNVAAELERVIDNAISHSYAKRVNIIGHSAGGVVARYLVQRGVRQNSVKISKLILVGSPNNGTSDVYIKSSGLDRSLVDSMMNGIAGMMVPPSPDARGPYNANDPCTLMSPAPLRRTYDDSIPMPADVRTTNIIGVGIDTPYDIVSVKTTRSGWFTFDKRTLRRSDQCLDLKEFRRGDGSISQTDATLSGADVLVSISADLVPKLLRSNLTPHVFLLDDTNVRREILRALDVQR